eukprot:COSAG01_NODE_58221_length_307_cov_0.980769_1_plen_74_part_01
MQLIKEGRTGILVVYRCAEGRGHVNGMRCRVPRLFRGREPFAAEEEAADRSRRPRWACRGQHVRSVVFQVSHAP